MSSRGRKVLAALIFTASAAVAAEEKTTLQSFANWRIDALPANQSLLLIGVPEKGAYFAAQCFNSSDRISFMYPMWDEQKKDIVGYKQIPLTVWDETQSPEIMFFANYLDNTAISISGTDQNSPIQASGNAMLRVLHRAKEFFAISSPGATRLYPAKHLPAALRMFDMSCALLREKGYPPR